MKFNNKKYKFGLKESDLIGDIKNFPIEIVEKMLERQKGCNNEIDVTIFQKSRTKDFYNGGFRWNFTIEGYEFWKNVIFKKKFDVFFKKYPKK